VVSVDANPRLVVSLSGEPSTDVESQIIACQLSSGIDVETSLRRSEAALQQVREWADRERASAWAGLTDSRVLHRRQLVNRIDKAIENAPPQSRRRRLTVAAKARSVAASPHSAAIEAELTSLAMAQLSDDEWLAAVAKLESAREETPTNRNDRELRVHVVLLLCHNPTMRVRRLQQDQSII
jgi:hypothetical protein